MQLFWSHLTNPLIGQVFYDDTERASYFLRSATSELMAVSANPLFQSYMADVGLLSKDDLAKQGIATVGQRAMKEGIAAKVYALAHYDEPTNTTYLNLGGNRLARVKASGIEFLPNGTDAVLFKWDDQQALAITTADLPTLNDGLKWTDTELCRGLDGNWAADSELTPSQARQLFFANLIKMLLPMPHETKPIVLLRGEHRCGKTLLGRKVGCLLQGGSFSPTTLTSDVQSLELLLANEPLLLLDNVDNLKARDMQDRIAMASSGGQGKQRKLYSDKALIARTYRASVFITSRTNPLDRADITDRELIFSLVHYNEPGNEARVMRDFIAGRERNMAELLVRLQNCLAALEAVPIPRLKSDLRLQNCSEVLLRIAEHEGWADEMLAVLNAAAKAQHNEARQDDVLLLLLDELIASTPAVRVYTTQELMRSLHTLAGGIDLPWKLNVKSFANQLKIRLTVLKTEYGITKRINLHTKNSEYVVAPTLEMLSRCGGKPTVGVALLPKKNSQSYAEEPPWVTPQSTATVEKPVGTDVYLDDLG